MKKRGREQKERERKVNKENRIKTSQSPSTATGWHRVDKITTINGAKLTKKNYTMKTKNYTTTGKIWLNKCNINEKVVVPSLCLTVTVLYRRKRRAPMTRPQHLSLQQNQRPTARRHRRLVSKTQILV